VAFTINSREQRWFGLVKRSFAVLQAAAFFTPNGTALMIIGT
jgi:hypothetical protein